MIRASPTEAGIDRIEARFSGNGFSPHRHDTYALGLTISGVQTFRYRGEKRASLPGQVIVIHPDELHDGGAGTERGLRYRMIYIPPELIGEALKPAGFAELPFVATPVLSDPHFRQDLGEALEDIDREMGAFKRESLLTDLAACLNRYADSGRSRKAALHWPAIRDCASYLKESCGEDIRMEDLESIAQMDRFSLARQFRKAFGTSPHRYLVMRRLDKVKTMLAKGEGLAVASVEGGFADQSHMTRHFKRAFGMTPGHWRRLCTANERVV
ncbi:AraC family transcriptional regulator [Roseibium sp.]|uniref:AraC family transcriptional regulator n=1 Tax=Roseibium sp. TaxID=1936156 RepID=UPI003D0FFA4F